MSRPSKRQKTRVIKLGAPEEDDSDLPTAHFQENAPSSTAWSSRSIPHQHPISLEKSCMRVFAHNLKTLSTRPTAWERVKEQLKLVPVTLVPPLFETLSNICPTILSNAFITEHRLLRGSSVILTDELPGINKFTISAIGFSSSHEQLVELHLRGLLKMPDDLIASLLYKLPALKVLVLRECIKVGPKSAQAAGESCPRLTTVNLSYTAVTPVSLVQILTHCHDLEVLKLAGIPNWTDATFGKLLTALHTPDGTEFRLPKLKTLKLRQTFLSDPSINAMLAICPNLHRLDLSFTAVRHVSHLSSCTSLEKLSLTSTGVSSVDVLKIVSSLTMLRTLSLGALGRSSGSAAAISNSSAMTLTDQTLQKLTGLLLDCPNIENISLVGNTKLGAVSRTALEDFVRLIGRRCKILNLAGIPSLRSSDLEGLLAQDDQLPCALEILVLNNTGVDDSVAPYVASCARLQVLEVGGTKLTYAGLDVIIDACSNLERLNLTSCRGVDVAHRRRYFEVYEERHGTVT